MKLRDLWKMNFANDGTRSLYESIQSVEVLQALKKWTKSETSGVLIGGLALSYYVKPRFTQDCDFLYLSSSQIPSEVHGFKRSRPSAFLDKETHVEIEVVTPNIINITDELATMIISSSKVIDGVRIASREGLIASKLTRFRLQDRADIEALLELGIVDLTDYPLTATQQKNFQTALAEFENR